MACRELFRLGVRWLPVAAAVALALGLGQPVAARAPAKANEEIMSLPPLTTGHVSLDDALRRRRSVRVFSASSSARALTSEHIGQLCWAAQGITEPAAGLRTAPSAGALYPLELYVVMPGGVFRYEPRGHRLRRVDAADQRAVLSRAALGQDAVRLASTDLVITAVLSRTRAKYGDRAERFAHLEAGHAAQNVLLEATSLGLAAVPIGAFDDGEVRRAIGAPAEELPLYVIAIGHPTG